MEKYQPITDAEYNAPPNKLHGSVWMYVVASLLVLASIFTVWYTVMQGWSDTGQVGDDSVSGSGESGPFPSFSGVATFDPQFAALAQFLPKYILDPETTIDQQFSIGDPDTYIEDMARLRELVLARDKFTLTQLERAQDSVFHLPLTADQSVNELFSDESTPITRAFMDRVLAEIDAYTLRLQSVYDVARPSQADPTFVPAFEPVSIPSVPSLEAVRAYTIAQLVTALDPQYKEFMTLWAESVVYQTQVAGLNYPYAVTAGQQVASSYFEHLLVNQQFQVDLAAAQVEYQSLFNGASEQSVANE